MSTKILYHMFGIRGYQFNDFQYYRGTACMAIGRLPVFGSTRNVSPAWR